MSHRTSARTGELERAVGSRAGRNPLDHGFQILANLVVGLEPEEVEAPQEVVVQGQELQVQLGQRQTVLACKEFGLDAVGAPQLSLGTLLPPFRSPAVPGQQQRVTRGGTCAITHLVGVQRHGVDSINLRYTALVP